MGLFVSDPCAFFDINNATNSKFLIELRAIQFESPFHLDFGSLREERIDMSAAQLVKHA